MLAKCVWGETYVRTMLDYNLPSLLAEGNLPAVAAAHDIEHVIYTTRADAAVIAAHPAHGRLARVVPTRFEDIDDGGSTGYGAVIRRMNTIHNRILRDCRTHGAIWLFDQPDHVWADGALLHLARRSEAGARCCVFPAIRTVAERVMPALEPFRRAAEGCIAVSPPALVRIALEHMHVHDMARVWGPDTATIWPHHISWRVGPQALLRRAFFHQPFTVAPGQDSVEAERSVDMHYIDRAFPDPDTLDFITDTNEFFVLEVSTQFHVIDPNPHPLTLPLVATWASANTSAYQRACFGRAIRIRAEPVPERRWKRMERHTARVHAAVDATVRLHGLHGWLRDGGRVVAARLLGRVLRDAAALRRSTLPKAATFLLPPDAWLAGFEGLAPAALVDRLTGLLLRPYDAGQDRQAIMVGDGLAVLPVSDMPAPLPPPRSPS